MNEPETYVKIKDATLDSKMLASKPINFLKNTVKYFVTQCKFYPKTWLMFDITAQRFLAWSGGRENKQIVPLSINGLLESPYNESYTLRGASGWLYYPYKERIILITKDVNNFRKLYDRFHAGKIDRGNLDTILNDKAIAFKKYLKNCYEADYEYFDKYNRLLKEGLSVQNSKSKPLF